MADRREFDAVSLVLGLVLLAWPVLYLVRDLTDDELDLRWAGPVALVVAGAAGLLTALRSDRSAARGTGADDGPATD